MGRECAFQTSALILILVGNLTWAEIPKLFTIREDIDTTRLKPCKAAKIGIVLVFSCHSLICKRT